MFTLDPLRMFEVKIGTSTEVCPVLSIVGIGAVANNQLLVTAVTGKRIRVMGWIVQSNTSTAGVWQLKSASGGTVITIPLEAPPRTNGATHDLPITLSGYCETSTGQGLYVDVATAAVNMQIFYIVYTP